MQSAFDWIDLVPELLNILLALIFLGMFVYRIRRLKLYSETTRFSYISPRKRYFFIGIFILASVAQTVLSFYYMATNNIQQNQDNFSYTIGTWINSMVLIVEVVVMRAQIKTQQPYTPIHRIYWIYLPIITCLRLVEQFVKKSPLADLIVSAVLFVDAMALCIYSLFIKKQEIKQFEHYTIFQFEDTLKQSLVLQRGNTSDKTKQEFNRLSVMVSLVDLQTIELKTYYKEQLIVVKERTTEEIERFYIAAMTVNIKSRLHFDNGLRVKELSSYFNELTSCWRNYQPFVFEFLGLSQQHQTMIKNELGHVQRQSLEKDEPIRDPCAIYFNINIWRVIRLRDHFQFLMSVETQDGKYTHNINKRFNQFQELDKKLRAVQIKSCVPGSTTVSSKIRPPDLPDKFYIVLDEQALDERLLKLTEYSRRLLNDWTFVVANEETKRIILDFYGFQDYRIPLIQKSTDLQDLSCFKGSISTRISQRGDVSVVYGFSIRQGSFVIGQIVKRYSDFVQFHKELKRWASNMRIDLHNINLPPKAITLNERQRQQRHVELTSYLNNIMQHVPGIHMFYEYRLLLQIERESEDSAAKQITLRREDSKISRERGQSRSGAADMSDLIEELGTESTRII